jgi:hypothetical protein
VKWLKIRKGWGKGCWGLVRLWLGSLRRLQEKIENVLSYSDLMGWMRRGFKNGNWRRLSPDEKGYFKAAVWYAKVKGRIVNAMVVGFLQAIIEKIRETRSIQILKAGMAKARKMLTQNSEVFKWCPRLRVWLLDRTYVFWLGLTELSTEYSAYMVY